MSQTDVSEETTALLVKPDETPLLTYHQAIDARIRALLDLAALDPAPGGSVWREQVRALKGARNAASPACRVPLEVLQEIFLSIEYQSAEFGAPWISFTYVCQYWRNAALGCPALWATIAPPKGPHNEAMLERAGDAPLHVEVTQTTIRLQSLSFLAMIKKALSHTARLRSVTLFLDSNIQRQPGSPIPWYWLTEPAAREEASLLQELCITSPQTFPRSTITDDNPKLLRGGAPVLRSLSVTILFDFGTLDMLPFGPQMTRLTLWTYDKPVGSVVDVGSIPWRSSALLTLVEALKGMPHLEELCVGLNLSDTHSSGSWTGVSQVTLPALRVLRFQDYGLTVERFLKVVRFPQVAFVELGLETPTTRDTFVQVLTLLRAPTPCVPSTSIRYLDISQFHSTFSVWFASPDHTDAEEEEEEDKTRWYAPTDTDSAPLAPLRVSYPNAGTDEVLNFFATHFDLSTLRALRVVPETTLRPGWLGTLASLPELATLSLGITQLEQLVDLLHALKGYTRQSPSGDLVPLAPGSFPSLKKVSVAGFGYAMNEIQRRRKRAERGRGVQGWDASWDIVKAVTEGFKARPLVTQLELGTSRYAGEEEGRAIEDIRAVLPGLQVSVQEQPGWDDMLSW